MINRYRDYSLQLIAIAIWCVALSAAISHAAIQTQPTSLNPGDQYRLAFITSGAMNPTATQISTYNDFVAGFANSVPELLVLGAEWKVIGSTKDINARENTGTDPSLGGVPIFLLNDTRIATNYSDLWDGVLENDLIITETGGTTSYDKVWTGTGNDGTSYSAQYLGDAAPLFGDPTPAPGGPGSETNNINGWMFDWADLPNFPTAYYAMSSVLTVPGEPGVVPEPTSFLVWGSLALTCIAGHTSRRSRIS